MPNHLELQSGEGIFILSKCTERRLEGLKQIQYGMRWGVSLLLRVLKYHTDSYVKNDFEVLTKRRRETIVTVLPRTMVAWERVLVIKIVSNEYRRLF